MYQLERTGSNSIHPEVQRVLEKLESHLTSQVKRGRF